MLQQKIQGLSTVLTVTLLRLALTLEGIISNICAFLAMANKYQKSIILSALMLRENFNYIQPVSHFFMV